MGGAIVIDFIREAPVHRTLFAIAFLVVLAGFAVPLANKAQRDVHVALAEKFPGKRFFVELNGGVSRLVGRRYCNGVYRTPRGILLSEFKVKVGDVSGLADCVSRFSDWLAQNGTPYVYIQVPDKIDMRGNMLPQPFENSCNETTDAFLAALKERGVRTFDTREILTATEDDVIRYFYRTDHHWNNDAVFKVFGGLIPILSRACGVDSALLEPVMSEDSWNRNVWKRCFVGTKARRTGCVFGGVDDLIVYTPKFETDMSICIPSRNVSLSGDFRKTVMWCADKIRRRDGNLFKMDAYSMLYIGGIFGVVRQRNNTAPLKLKLMIVGDSYARPLAAFLSTVFSEVITLDQRRFAASESVAGFLADFKPDLVLQMNSPVAVAVSANGIRADERDLNNSVLFEYGELR